MSQQISSDAVVGAWLADMLDRGFDIDIGLLGSGGLVCTVWKSGPDWFYVTAPNLLKLAAAVNGRLKEDDNEQAEDQQLD